MKEIYNKSVSVIVLFILINAGAFLFKGFLHEHGFGIRLLLIANLLLFVLTTAGFFIQMRAIKSSNINAFIRGVYVNLLLKIFIVIIALGIYLFVIKGKVNKPSLFTAMGLYILYTSIEVRQLMKISRKKTDA
ncbi:hypothetical protein FW778_17800 [Ginsengibacter hankyongi]|uniref:ATP synthase I chain n=1 Tax=Ginsengibacter hankyongi TaxID=2607284 RepID=A0A5J5ID50_9BACT|nr:hypothetical protein [Ginsengibacter hankyongi]KAA9037280.1 hypothetical protein FW778_17800 [Ginsengibacter hankyongi]